MSAYHPTSNPCVYVKDGALYVKTAAGEFEPYSYEGGEVERLKGIIAELIEELVFYEGDELIGVPADIMKRAREAIQ